MLYLLLTLVANAASLDLIEVGGAWGTPAATDANAVFWNPAGLAVGDGTYFSVEVAPTLGTINTNRNHEYWGGEDQLKFNGVVPYIGVSSDFGHAPLGVGLSLSVPFARGGKSQNDPGPGRYHLREGGSQTIFATGAASYQIKNLISIGASLSFVHSQWDALLDTETTTQLSEALCETSADHCNNYAPTEAGDPPADYWIEDPNYATTLTFDGLKHNTFTFGTGIYVTPIDMLGISISYMHGGTLKHAGPVNMDFDCPDSEDDPMGYIGADLNGICDAKMSGDAIIEYKMPWRLNTGILLKPLKGSDKLQIEAMG
ncbi:MAG: hypothetical protein HN348_14975, partial [Proteobacteria bacterium]|nr:hypothetical protein [Pseudomonadota bacterium]